MIRRRDWLKLAVSSPLLAQEPEASEKPVEYLCPMDKEVRERKPGKCPICGMKLLAGLPDPVEYPVHFTTSPSAPRAGQKVRLRWEIRHPKTHAPVPDLELVHERIFHLFLLSEDREHFAHEHPEQTAPGVFEMDWVFAQGGMWRLLSDFFPTGATPQLIPHTLLLPPTEAVAPKPEPRNVEVKLRLEPAVPLAGERTLLFYEVSPREKFEPFLGAMGHMLVASEDLIDLLHTHPAIVDGAPAEPPKTHKLLQFNLIFPRPGVYRVWAQFQRDGIVNTVAHDVAVKAL